MHIYRQIYFIISLITDHGKLMLTCSRPKNMIIWAGFDLDRVNGLSVYVLQLQILDTKLATLCCSQLTIKL